MIHYILIFLSDRRVKIERYSQKSAHQPRPATSAAQYESWHTDPRCVLE